MKREVWMETMHKVLILGTGAAAVQIAVNFKNTMGCIIGIAGRISIKSRKFFDELSENKNRICVQIQNMNHAGISGECIIDYSFMGYSTITGEWDTIILAVTNDAYISVIKNIDNLIMKYVRRIILVTPAIGSNTLVYGYLRSAGYNVEVISLSSYYASTRGYESSVKVLTNGVKKKIYIASTQENSDICGKLSGLFQRLGIETEVTKNAWEAESRNISIYVHPPIFMNDYALDFIFGSENTVKYAYKFYPEGPLTQYVIHDLLEQWKEISEILTGFNVSRFNLLIFMNDDNYPVMPQSLSRDDIENFLSFEPIKQEYLIYIRYTSLLVDPFSVPDKNGRYFDFSAIQIQKIYQDEDGYWRVPRIPKEEYYRLKILQGIGRETGIQTPVIDKFIGIYEEKLNRFRKRHGDYRLSDDFITRDFSSDIAIIRDNAEIEGIKKA
jgi:hypothetical protein